MTCITASAAGFEILFYSRYRLCLISADGDSQSGQAIALPKQKPHRKPVGFVAALKSAGRYWKTLISPPMKPSWPGPSKPADIDQWLGPSHCIMQFHLNSPALDGVKV